MTGCTGGIGLEFARQLAAKGFNVVLLGRRPDALQEVATELGKLVRQMMRRDAADTTLETKFKVQTKTISVDLMSPEARAPALREIEQLSKSLDLGILSKPNPPGTAYT